MSNKTYSFVSWDEYGDLDGNLGTQFVEAFPTSAKSFAKSGNNYIGTDIYGHVYISTTLKAGSWTKTFTNTWASSTYCQKSSLRIGSDSNVYFGCMNDIGGTKYFCLYQSTDDGASWSLYGKCTEGSYTEIQFGDCFEIGGVWFVWGIVKDGTVNFYIATYNMDTETRIDIDCPVLAKVILQVAGFVSNSIYYFAVYSGSNFYTYSFNGSAHTSLHTYSNADMGITPNVSMYDLYQLGTNMMTISAGDYITAHIFHDFATSTDNPQASVLATKGGSTSIQACAIGDEDDNYTLKYVAATTAYYGPVYVWKALKVSGCVYLGTFSLGGNSHVLSFGIGDYIDMTSRIVQRQVMSKRLTILGNPTNTYVDFSPKNVKYYSDQFKGQKISFNLDVDDGFAIEDGEYVEIYETSADPDIRLVFGYVDLEASEPDIGQYTIVDGSEKDFSKKVTVAWTADKSHEMLQDLIDDECDFLEGTIADDSFADWAYSAKDVEIRKVIQDIMNHDYHLFQHDSEDQCAFLDDPLAGSPTITLDSSNMGDPEVKRISYPIAEVRLTGKWNAATGDYLRSVWYSSDPNLPSQNILSDAFPYISVQADLDNMASAIGSMKKNQIYQIAVEIYDVDELLEYGDIVDVCYPLKGIGTEDGSYNPVTYETFMVTRSAQNDNGYLYLEMVSAFIFTRGRESEPSTLKETAQLAVTANERIETVGSALDLKANLASPEFTNNLYLLNGKVIAARNAANNAWINLIQLGGDNYLYLGAGTGMGYIYHRNTPWFSDNAIFTNNKAIFWFDTAYNPLNIMQVDASKNLLLGSGASKIYSYQNIEMASGKKITSLADPTSAQDAATKAYTDTKIGGSTGSTDNAILRADGTGGKTSQSSSSSIDDSGYITTPRINIKNNTAILYFLNGSGTEQGALWTDGSYLTLRARSGTNLQLNIGSSCYFFVRSDGVPISNGYFAVGNSMEVSGNAYFGGNVSAASFTDRTPYPKDLNEALAAVKSIKRITKKAQDGITDEISVDHENLHAFIKSEVKHKEDSDDFKGTDKLCKKVNLGRDLSATVSAQNEVIKHLLDEKDTMVETIRVQQETIDLILEKLKKAGL